MADDRNSSSDESLDPHSEKFDPLKAIYASNVKIPTPKAPLYDNLTKYESVMKGLFKPKDGPSKEPPKRRFLPHQQMVPGTKSAREKILSRKNVLTKMQRAQGPLGALCMYMENKVRVKVFTRNAQGVRGFVEAYIVAFDKHWNLALEDCLEVWTRKKKRKAPALGSSIEVKRDENVPKVIVKESNKKTETLERHVPQLLLRGEQIAIIVKIN